MKNFAILTAATAALLSTGASASQFVTNGDFSQLSNGLGLLAPLGPLPAKTSATGWTTTGYNVVFNNATTANGSPVALWDKGNSSGYANNWDGTAPGGSNFVGLNGDFYSGPISQTITGLKVGQSYTLSYEYAFSQQMGYYGATSQNLAASFGGVTVFQNPSYSLPTGGFSGWTTETLQVTATSTSEVLSFLGSGSPQNPPFALLTGVSLTGAVPEPATWGMMIVGLGVMGAAARRRRQVLTTA